MQLTNHNDDLACDMIQETFLRYVVCQRRIGKIEHPRAYLFRIATLLARNHSRKQRRRQRLSLAIPLASEREYLMSDDFFNDFLVLRAVWSRLGPEERIVAEAVVERDMNQIEISRLTGLSRAAVQRRIEKIRIHARKFCEE